MFLDFNEDGRIDEADIKNLVLKLTGEESEVEMAKLIQDIAKRVRLHLI